MKLSKVLRSILFVVYYAMAVDVDVSDEQSDENLGWTNMLETTLIPNVGESVPTSVYITETIDTTLFMAFYDHLNKKMIGLAEIAPSKIDGHMDFLHFEIYEPYKGKHLCIPMVEWIFSESMEEAEYIDLTIASDEDDFPRATRCYCTAAQRVGRHEVNDCKVTYGTMLFPRLSFQKQLSSTA